MTPNDLIYSTLYIIKGASPIIRDPNDIFYVPDEVWPVDIYWPVDNGSEPGQEYYPPYIQGPFMVTSPQASRKIVKAAEVGPR